MYALAKILRPAPKHAANHIASTKAHLLSTHDTLQAAVDEAVRLHAALTGADASEWTIMEDTDHLVARIPAEAYASAPHTALYYILS